MRRAALHRFCLARTRRAPTRLALSLVALCLVLAALVPRARADGLPIIVTYELKKQRQATRILARNPQAFWIRQIVARIEANTRAMSKPLKAALTVQLSFVVGRDGHLRSKAVATSSGNEEVDRTALAILAHAQPFPPMPEAMGDDQLSFTLPVRFR